MARGSPEPKVGGASGDVRQKSSNVAGTKGDRQMSSDTSATGSPGGSKVVAEKAKKSTKR